MVNVASGDGLPESTDKLSLEVAGMSEMTVERSAAGAAVLVAATATTGGDTGDTADTGAIIVGGAWLIECRWGTARVNGGVLAVTAVAAEL